MVTSMLTTLKYSQLIFPEKQELIIWRSTTPILSTYNGVSTDKFIFSIILEYFSRENGSNVPYVPTIVR